MVSACARNEHSYQWAYDTAEHGHESLFDLDTAQEKLGKTVVEIKSVSKQSKISSIFKAS